jgi:hypothetical protein
MFNILILSSAVFLWQPPVRVVVFHIWCVVARCESLVVTRLASPLERTRALH